MKLSAKIHKILGSKSMGNLIVKDNALIEASHKLGEAEQRLILLAILKGREYCDSVELLKGKELIIHADDYAKTFGITPQMAYVSLKKAVMGLYRAEWGYKYINDKGSKVVRHERFIQSAQYIEGEGVVSFKFADAIIPKLIELKKHFTAYEIQQVAELSSSYAMRLYEFFMQYLDKSSGKGWLEISIDELRFRFGLLPTEYEKMCNFKSRILDYSIKQINENTDLSVTYTQKKQGRTITGFKFEFKKQLPKAKKLKQIKKLEQQEEAEFKKKQETEMRKQALITKFESLTTDEQEKVLDTIAEEFDVNPFRAWFDEARAKGEAHKNDIFILQFFEYFKI